MGCFLKRTLLKAPDGTLKVVSSLQVGHEVASAPNGNPIRIASVQWFPQAQLDLMSIQTASSRLVVTSDHRVALAGGLVKCARNVQIRDRVMCGTREQEVTSARLF